MSRQQFWKFLRIVILALFGVCACFAIFHQRYHNEAAIGITEHNSPRTAEDARKIESRTMALSSNSQLVRSGTNTTPHHQFSNNRKNDIRRGNSSQGMVLPCGEVCQVSIPDKKRLITKNFNCTNIFLRQEYPEGLVHDPPLNWAQVPEDVKLKLLKNGKMGLNKEWYCNDITSIKNKSVFEENDIKAYFQAQPPLSSYSIDGLKVWTLLQNYSDTLRGRTGIVIGSTSPWIEVMLLRLGVVKHVYTVDFQPVVFKHPQLSFINMFDLADGFLQGSQEQFDFAVSFSSIEHSGLGRYSDPLNPWGDQEAVAQVWCMLKPGGMFFLGLPRTEHAFGTLVFNAHREYGEGLWRQLAANYDIVQWRYREGNEYHEISVLQKSTY